MGTRVLLASEMIMLRQPLKAFLESHGLVVVAEASHGHDAVDLARKHRPDVVVLDIALPRVSALQAARELRRTCPSVGMILLTMPDQERDSLEVLRCGVRGLLLKTQPIEDLLLAIREVKRGGIYFGPSASDAVLQIGRPTPKGVLTPREREVLKLVAEGKSTKEVASILGISVKTAGFHRDRLMKKLNIHETAGLVRYAIKRGVIVP